MGKLHKITTSITHLIDIPSSWSLQLALVYLAAVPVYPHECYSLDGTEPLRPVITHTADQGGGLEQGGSIK